MTTYLFWFEKYFYRFTLSEVFMKKIVAGSLILTLCSVGGYWMQGTAEDQSKNNFTVKEIVESTEVFTLEHELSDVEERAIEQTSVIEFTELKEPREATDIATGISLLNLPEDIQNLSNPELSMIEEKIRNHFDEGGLLETLNEGTMAVEDVNTVSNLLKYVTKVRFSLMAEDIVTMNEEFEKFSSDIENGLIKGVAKLTEREKSDIEYQVLEEYRIKTSDNKTQREQILKVQEKELANVLSGLSS